MSKAGQTRYEYKGEEFFLYPNQKLIKIDSIMTIEQDETYMKVNQEALRAAMENLPTMGALKLWLYLSRHCDGYTFALSSKDCKTDWGISESTYRSALIKLEELGYLENVDGTLYKFKQYP